MLERHRRGDADGFESRGSLFIIRQIINILFMLTAIVGVVMYFIGDNETTSTFIIMFAIALKMFECVLRLLK